MTGSSVFDYIHQSDHAELAEQLGLGLAHGSGASVPSPASEDGSSNSATNNPDGNYNPDGKNTIIIFTDYKSFRLHYARRHCTTTKRRIAEYLLKKTSCPFFISVNFLKTLY